MLIQLGLLPSTLPYQPARGQRCSFPTVKHRAIIMALLAFTCTEAIWGEEHLHVHNEPHDPFAATEVKRPPINKKQARIGTPKRVAGGATGGKPGMHHQLYTLQLRRGKKDGALEIARI